MRRLLVLAAALLVAGLPASARAQFFFDNFDSYVAGSTIMGQGGWETWGGAPGANTTVTNARAFSSPNSLLDAGAADIVHQFSGVNSGVWYVKDMTYVPSSQTGEVWFILLNQYTGSGGNWSVQLVMCQSGCTTAGAVAGQAVNIGGTDVPGAGSAALITDQWVEVMAQINFNTNQYTLYYNGVAIDTQQWTVTGTNQLAAIDLFSNTSSESYVDDVWVDTTVPVELTRFTAE